MFSLVELKKYTVEDDSCTKNLMLNILYKKINTEMKNLWKEVY